VPCDAGNPCSPPPAASAAAPPPPDATVAANVNTGANGFTGSCSSQSSYVWSCLDGVKSCFGESPTVAQVNKIFSQQGCSVCQSSRRWSWTSKSSDGAFGYYTSGGLVGSYCEISDSSTKNDASSLSFCCD
jgi:hypothetical protein